MKLMQSDSLSVIPAQAGIQSERRTLWIPACAGMTKRRVYVFATLRIRKVISYLPPE
jgi:hypothetical protein